MMRISWEEYQRIKDIKYLDLQVCFYCSKLNILNLGWKPFGKWYCLKHEKEYYLCWELCYKACRNILGCELKQIRAKKHGGKPKVAVNRTYDLASCYLCGKELKGASKKGVVKNRNNPLFWGIKSVYKILCLNCMGKEFYERMKVGKRKTWKKYVRRGYV